MSVFTRKTLNNDITAQISQLCHDLPSVPSLTLPNTCTPRNTIQWSETMGEVFMKNYQEHSEYLVWQYIGTPQGVMRTYPAMSLYPLSRTNFDVRKRPWYNAGRKNFSILRDRSHET